MSETKLSPSDVAAMVRQVTDEEVAHYHEHGWVHLPQLVAPELAAELRRVGDEIHRNHVAKPDDELQSPTALALNPDAEPYGSYALSEAMCRNAQRLITRNWLTGSDFRVRYGGDIYVYRPPSAPSAGRPRQGWHQDSPEHGTDRIGEMKFWLALHDIGPENGPMRFIDRSHRDGPLASVLNGDGVDLLDLFPKLADRVTPPMVYKLGDATAHDGYTAHGTLPNITDRPRVSHICGYTPIGTRWINGVIRNWGSERKPLADDVAPLIYSGGRE